MGMLKMKKVILLVGCVVMCQGMVWAAPPVNYEGFGAVTRGALDAPGGYETYHVTTLDDDGSPGTLRDAVSQGSRLIVFDVGGTITLSSTLNVDESYVTIDGSTAPDPGITIVQPHNVGTVIMPNNRDAHDIIIRYVRNIGQGGHPGNSADIWGLDGMDGHVYNIIIDHVTGIACEDGVFDIYGEVSDVTISWCILMDTLATLHISYYPQNRERISLHHNVFARNNERQIRMRHHNDLIDFVNNVIYGWGWMEGGAAGLHIGPNIGMPDEDYPTLNVENNVYHYVSGLHGSEDNAIRRDNPTGKIYFNGNIFPAGENDNYDTSARHVIPAYAEVTKYDASTLGDTVVPFAGTHYPTQEEQDLLNEVSLAIGGQGGVSSGIDKLILISLDGLQLNHFNEMLTAGRLPNFESFINNGGFNGQVEITHHSNTGTAPGYAEMLSGFGDDVTGVSDNSGDALPDGLSVFEKINSARDDVVLGSIWGKDTSYVPEELLLNAISEIDWWQDFTTWNQEQWEDKPNYATANSVANKATEFISQYASNSFFFFVHFEDTDAAGHKYGENSVNYDQALLDMDQGLSILINELQAQGIEDDTEIIITSDHGFVDDGTSHGDGSDPDNRIVPLMSNNALLVGEITSNGVREQCEITPTILDYFGIDITDLEAYGCDSMMIETTSQAPVADAGVDQTLTDSDDSGSEQVTLDGSGSTDPDGSIVSFIWQEDSIQIASGVSPSVDLSIGTHTVILAVTDNDGLTDTDEVIIIVDSPQTDDPIDPEDTPLPERPEMKCYNNVFNPTKGEEAIVHIELDKQVQVTIVIYDNKGKEIKTVVDEEKSPGFYTSKWNGKDDAGNAVGSGIYIVHMEAGGYTETKKIAVVK